MRSVVAEAGLEDEIEIASAGCGPWHIGHPPDERATEAARRRGIVLEGKARQIEPEDFAAFDLILAADRENVADLLTVAPDEAAREKIHLLREYDPESDGDLEVPDPYYGGDDGFETVLDMIDAACRGLLEELR
jgi:protein-tyrosine phosphatase